MIGAYLAMLAALVTLHVATAVSLSAGVLTALGVVGVFALVDLGAVVARKLRGVAGKGAVRS